MSLRGGSSLVSVPYISLSAYKLSEGDSRLCLPITHLWVPLTDLYLLSAQEHLLNELVRTKKSFGTKSQPCQPKAKPPGKRESSLGGGAMKCNISL